MATVDSPPMSVQLPARPLTLDDVAVLAAADDVHRYELQEGNLLITPPADTGHATLITRLVGWFAAAGYSTDVCCSPLPVRVSPSGPVGAART